MTKKYFGTDGIRGRVGSPTMSPDFVLKLGWAAGKVLANSGNRKVLIGKDTRISGYMFEAALEAGLIAAGADARMLGPLPTPAIAYLTQTLRANAGIVISASHNPFCDNGIKFLGPNGSKLSDELEAAIEAELDKEFVTCPSDELGKAKRIVDAAGRYIEFCKSTFPNEQHLTGLKLVVDSANGAGYITAPRVFKELGAEVINIGNQPDGLNINKECGATHSQTLAKAVLEHDADAGIALDGDGDRIIMVDEKGRILDGDEIIYLIARKQKQAGLLKGGVVGTVMSNLGLELALKQLDVPFKRAKVGDRHVMELLNDNDWQIGGEPSGHVICLHATPSGDAIIAALQVLSAMVSEGEPLSFISSNVSKLPQVMINVPTGDSGATKVNTNDLVGVQSAIQDAESELGDDGRVLLRPSGTEPLVRVMVEGKSAQQVKKVCENLAKKVEKALKS